MPKRTSLPPDHVMLNVVVPSALKKALKSAAPLRDTDMQKAACEAIKQWLDQPIRKDSGLNDENKFTNQPNSAIAPLENQQYYLEVRDALSSLLDTNGKVLAAIEHLGQQLDEVANGLGRESATEDRHNLAKRAEIAAQRALDASRSGKKRSGAPKSKRIG